MYFIEKSLFLVCQWRRENSKYRERNRNKNKKKHSEYTKFANNMGAKDSKPSCISYEDAIKRGKCEIVYFRRHDCKQGTNEHNDHTNKRSRQKKKSKIKENYKE